MTDNNVIKGKLKQAEGLTEEAVADVTGSDKHHADGMLKQAEGKIQEAVGHVADAIKEGIHNVEVEIDKHRKH
ncbi:MAG TPA: CsbD family protein [Capsulimonadaceae bacterium]|jgi:uncharacterized protein YjbJ (UPF0337 family)